MSDPDLEAVAAPSFDAARFREVMGHFPTGVTVITTVRDGTPAGFTAQSFVSVSLDPPLVAFFPARTSASWAVIRDAGVFCVNVLSDDQEALCRAFATSGGDKFAGVAWRPAGTGSPRIDSCVAWIDCAVEAVHDAGDHEMVLGRVRDLGVENGHKPLLFYRGGFGRFES